MEVVSAVSEFLGRIDKAFIDYLNQTTSTPAPDERVESCANILACLELAMKTAHDTPCDRLGEFLQENTERILDTTCVKHSTEPKR